MTYTCPLCQSPLHQDAKRWWCDNRHSFDVAKQGYVNLLPVQHKKSRVPGDAADMVAAREAFLTQGHYQPLRESLVIAMQEQDRTINHLLDVGCGEGYYTRALSAHAQQVTALDIAKPAAMKTAKKCPDNVQALVASAAKLPLENASVDMITSIFSPIVPTDFARVLRASGTLIIAKPAQNHLIELRQQLFDRVADHDSDKFIGQLDSYFTLADKQTVSVPLTLGQTDIQHLLTMTPYAYKAKPEKRAAVASLTALTATADFILYVFGKRV